MALYGYCRVSTDEQGNGSSLDDQRATLHAYGVPPENIFTDDGVSGSMLLDVRPAGGEVLSKLQSGDRLVATKMDRLFRDAQDALNQVARLKADGKAVVLLDIGHGPVTENGPAKMFFTMMAAVAEFERTRIRERTADGRKAKKARGGHIGGKTPFGFRKVGIERDARLEPVQNQQQALKDIMTMRAQIPPASFTAITTMLHADGFKISRETVRRYVNREEGRTPPKRTKKDTA